MADRPGLCSGRLVARSGGAEAGEGALWRWVVGAAVCVWSFSPFAGRPSVNLHDFSVLPEAQGRGVGTAILEELERRARAHGAAKITLEVVATNEGARRLYGRYGFLDGTPPVHFLSKPLEY